MFYFLNTDKNIKIFQTTCPQGPTGIANAYIRTAIGTATLSSSTSVSATCDSGDFVVGGGFEFDPSVTQTQIVKSTTQGTDA